MHLLVYLYSEASGPNISFGMPVLKSINQYATKTLDVHLMIVNPEKYIEKFAELGSDFLTIHYEVSKDTLGINDKTPRNSPAKDGKDKKSTKKLFEESTESKYSSKKSSSINGNNRDRSISSGRNNASDKKDSSGSSAAHSTKIEKSETKDKNDRNSATDYNRKPNNRPETPTKISSSGESKTKSDHNSRSSAERKSSPTIPLEKSKVMGKCIITGKQSKDKVIFAKSY